MILIMFVFIVVLFLFLLVMKIFNSCHSYKISLYTYSLCWEEGKGGADSLEYSLLYIQKYLQRYCLYVAASLLGLLLTPLLHFLGSTINCGSVCVSILCASFVLCIFSHICFICPLVMNIDRGYFGMLSGAV